MKSDEELAREALANYVYCLECKGVKLIAPCPQEVCAVVPITVDVERWAALSKAGAEDLNMP